MNHPPLEQHLLPVPMSEVLMRRYPHWPASRPPIPPMCCENCLRAAAVWGWRFIRSLHLMAFETYDDDDDITHGAARPAATTAAGGTVAAWPWKLPGDLETGDDFVDAAGACRAAAKWCFDAAVRMGQMSLQAQTREDAALLAGLTRHMRSCESALSDDLAPLFAAAGAGGSWRRAEAVAIAHDLGHDMIEVALLPWP